MLTIRALVLAEGGDWKRPIWPHPHVSLFLPDTDKQGTGPEIFVCQFDLELLISMSNISGFHSREF